MPTLRIFAVGTPRLAEAFEIDDFLVQRPAVWGTGHQCAACAGKVVSRFHGALPEFLADLQVVELLVTELPNQLRPAWGFAFLQLQQIRIVHHHAERL